jgi:transposase
VEHIGIDLGAIHSHLAIVSAGGKPLGHKRLKTEELGFWLSRQPASHVVMEACTQSPVVGELAVAAGHHTKVVPGQLVRLLGVGARGIKTDDKDALALALASQRNDQLPTVHLRSGWSKSCREMLNARSILLESRKSIALSVKTWLRGRLQHLRGRADRASFAQRAREVALQHPEGLPLPIEIQLETFEHLCEQISTLNEQLEQMAKRDSVCSLLMTMPGVGVQVALSLRAHLDDPRRFGSSGELGSYLALVPGESTTGGKVRRTGTLKAGPRQLKALLVQAAWSMWRCRPNDPIVLWARAIADRKGPKGKRVAIVALARKMATVLWAMWKHSRHYDPQLASSVRLTSQSVA